MEAEFIDRIVDYASSKSKYAEARFIEIAINDLTYRNGEFEGLNFGVESGYAVRVLNNSISMAYTDSTNWEEIRESVDRAVKRSQFGGKNSIFEGDPVKDSWKVEAKKKIEDVSIDEKTSILKENDSSMKSAGASVRVNNLVDKRTHQTYVNSLGSDIRGDISRIYYFYLIGVVDNGEFEQSVEHYGSSSGYEYIDELNLEERIEHDIDDLHQAAAAPRINPGKFDIVVGPEISGIVAHESCGHPTEYDRIIGREGAQAGESFLTGKKQPYRIGSDMVSVVDDPSMEKSYGYYAYDDEGVRSRKRYLYKNGMTNEYILNRESAGILGVKSNGGGRSASWNMEPLARMSTTYVEPGTYKFDDLFDGIKRGIYIKSFTEWNIDDIRFNEKYVGKEAYLITNGDISGRVRRPVIETNTVSFYSAVDAIGRDLEFNAGTCGKGDPMQGVDVWMGGPHMRLREMYLQ